ncbi:MAG: competence/damage-inducible protein A [Candidatus Latescibacteria bacterium]|nr:competence/damage-inducible protein A [Candidatus Latescibacterota bacterium]
MTPVIEIIVVGNEILSGRTQDLNAAYMIDRMGLHGFTVRYESVIGDTVSDISEAFRIASGRSNVVLVTGGLGPTSDDVTVQALADAFDRELVLDENVLSHIESLFKRRKWFMSESNKKQAFVPAGAVPLTNSMGTAPGVLLKYDECSIFLMPGVPLEMQKMFDRVIFPRIQEEFEPEHVETASIKVSGLGESAIYDRIGHLPGAKKYFSYYPGTDGIEIKIRTDADAPMAAPQLSAEIIDILGDTVYSSKGESLETVVGNMLIAYGKTIGVAESCTGGYISHLLTNVPGSSAYLLAGVVVYSNESKHTVLGVDNSHIGQYGAVSAKVAGAMADGIRRITGASIGLSTTGIAGPGGGSVEKPVGLMYTGLSTVTETMTKKLQFVEDRLINKKRMSQAVLNILRLHLKKRFELS